MARPSDYFWWKRSMHERHYFFIEVSLLKLSLLLLITHGSKAPRFLNTTQVESCLCMVLFSPYTITWTKSLCQQLHYALLASFCRYDISWRWIGEHIKFKSFLIEHPYLMQSYEIKSPPWTICWFAILWIFSVEN